MIRTHASLARFAVLIVAMWVVIGHQCRAQDKGNSDQSVTAALPQEVRDALDRAARSYPLPMGGARWERVFQMFGTDHPIFQLQGSNNRGNRIEIEITRAGRIVEVEEHGIALIEVPAAVTEALTAKLPQFKPDKVEAIYQNGKTEPACYGFEGRDNGGKRVEIYLSADGKTVLN
jgi:hypothetical protein